MAVMQKLAATVLLAAVGAFLGMLYARWTLPPEVQESKALLAMYVSAGAAIAILAWRLGTILFMILREYRARHPHD
jgi:hypothetical protein